MNEAADLPHLLAKQLLSRQSQCPRDVHITIRPIIVRLSTTCLDFTFHDAPTSTPIPTRPRFVKYPSLNAEGQV